MRFIANKVLIDLYPLKYTSPRHLRTSLYVPSIVHSNAVAHHLSHLSTALLFLLLLLPQFSSMHLSHLGTDRKRTGLFDKNWFTDGALSASSDALLWGHSGISMLNHMWWYLWASLFLLWAVPWYRSKCFWSNFYANFGHVCFIM